MLAEESHISRLKPTRILGFDKALVRQGDRWVSSLKTGVLEQLRRETNSELVKDSLALILDYFLARSLLRRIAPLDERIDAAGRIHPAFVDQQAAGRISATKPNLQALAAKVGPDGKKRKFISDSFKMTDVRSRNVIVASAGHLLVAFDVAQADIRCLAAAIESFRAHHRNSVEFLHGLHLDRENRFGQRRRRLLLRSRRFIRRGNVKPLTCPRRGCGYEFPAEVHRHDPGLVCPECGYQFHFNDALEMGLANDFRAAAGDFYTVAIMRILGRPPADGAEREFFKQTVLGVVNGLSAQGLANRLNISTAEATELLGKFAVAYPDVDLFTRAMHEAIAITGTAQTFAGRTRRVTPHWWMVNNSAVELFVSYRGADKLWVRVIPLRPSRHTLTCYIESVIDTAKNSPRFGQEIYHHRDGRISQYLYRFFADSQLVYRLPFRNISWRLIRKVRTAKEEADYDGFDRTRRQLFNLICQGGTADIVRLMMIHCQPICEQFSARLVLQIHDELLFEVPAVSVDEFIGAMKPVLEQPPPGFSVPIVVEPKIGQKFGELQQHKK